MDAIDINPDQRPQRFAWAPGSYLAQCHHCGSRFVGDKRAHLCAPCAYNDEGLSHLKAENATFRAAQKACEDCDAPTVAEVSRLRVLLARWLKVYTDAMEEAQEVGNSDYNITVGLVCDTRDALKR